MPLMIGTTAFSQWHTLKPLLVQLGWNPDSADASSGLGGVVPDTRTSKGPYIFLHSRPERALAHALDVGTAPGQALSEWQASAERLLGLYKSQRKNAVMVDVASAAEHPGALVDWLKQNHSAFFEAASGITVAAGPEEPLSAPSELNLLMATQLVAQSASLQTLLPQLEACSVPLADEQHYAQPTVDVLAVHGQLNEQLDHGQSTVESLQSRLEDHEKRLLHAQRLETENQHLWDDLKAAKDAKAQAEANEKVLKEENELILNQLFQVQEELEKRYLNNRADNGQLAELQKANAELAQAKQQAEQKAEQQQTLLSRVEQALGQTETQLANYQQELSAQKQAHEQLEAQLVAQEQAMQERDAAKAGYEQTLPKLFHTQEELEQAVARIEELVNELDQLTEKVEYLNDQVDSKNEKLRNFSDERRQLKARLKLAQDALAHGQADRGLSALAKMTKPLRKLRRIHRLVDQQIHVIEGSDLFDRDWYAAQNPDVAAKFTNLAEHYVRHGGQEGRDPSPEFSSNGYLENNPDVVESGLNPLVHYLLHGKAEGRKI